MKEFEFKITDPVGLHARPASILVNSVKKVKSDVQIEYDGKKANLKSILGILGMSVPTEAVVKIYVDGPDEEETVEMIKSTLKETKMID